jgi:hypothetical protein
MNLKSKLIEILQDVNPKQYARRLTSFPDISQELYNQTKQYNPKNVNEQVYIILNSPPKKKQCGKYPLFNTFNLGYREFCGGKTVCECARNLHSNTLTRYHNKLTNDEKLSRQTKKETTCLAKYGVKNAALDLAIKEKIRITNNEKYGANSPLESIVIQTKIKQTNLEKYGVEKPFESAIIRQKGNDTTIERYGSLMSHARAGSYAKYGMNPFAHPTVKAKIKNTLLEKYNRSSPKHFHLSDAQLEILQNYDKFKNLLTDKTFDLAGVILGVSDSTIARYADYHNVREVKSFTKSVNEYIIKEILDEYNIQYIQNTKKIIAPYELDFYLPDYNSAIEVGSIWHHSELNGKRGKFYHWDKWTACSANNISLYQWFDDELAANIDVIRSKIKYITKKIDKSVGARHITISNVSVSDERKFLETNHIQGFAADRKYIYGGFYKSQLVGLITFAIREKYIELTRYATDISAVYPGLFSKLFKHAINQLPPGNIISFSANCHSNGNLYKMNNFEYSHIVKPTYFYTKNYHSKESRNGFMKKKLLEKHPNLDPTKTEWELMQELGYDRIWDAGKIAWIFKRD